jgi:hypothetical protein
MHSLLHLDWLSVTIPIDCEGSAERFKDFQLWRDIIAETYTRDGSKWKVSAPQYGYTHAYTSSHGTIAMVGRASMGLHIIYSAQSLQAIVSMGGSVERLIKNVSDMGGRATRVDVALDILDGKSNVDKFTDSVKRGAAITSSKSWRIMAGSEGGNTLYVGSRSSERMVRVYDKKAERAAKYEEVQASNWVRVEVELKGEQARNFMNACGSNDMDEVMKGFLVAACDFSCIPEYKQALSIVEGEIEPTTTKRKDTKTRFWLMSRIAPIIAKECAEDGEFRAKLMTEINALINQLLDKH